MNVKKYQTVVILFDNKFYTQIYLNVGALQKANKKFLIEISLKILMKSKSQNDMQFSINTSLQPSC